MRVHALRLTWGGGMVAAAFAIFAGCVLWSGYKWHFPPAAPPAMGLFPPSAYRSAEDEPERRDAGKWEEPPVGRSEADWVFDLFTPPTLFLDPRSGRFSTTPARAPAPAAAGPRDDIAPVGPFRLQLVGFVGGMGDYLGVFENERSGRHFLARAGCSVPELKLTIIDFDVRQVDVTPDDSMRFRAAIAVAVVRDEETGEDVAMTSRERRLVGGAARPLSDGEVGPNAKPSDNAAGNDTVASGR